jgi:hypothetical protein
VTAASGALWRTLAAGGAIVAAISCRSAGPVARSTGDSRVDSTAAAPADSLVASGSNGLEVWFTLARAGQAADGHSCTDRTLELRRGSSRIAVPLLYTGEAPRIVNDTTLEAVLYRDCRPLSRYRVDTRTGQPTPVRPAS